MSIYLVWKEVNYEGDYLLGVYASKEAAQLRADKAGWRTRIDEYVYNGNDELEVQ